MKQCERCGEEEMEDFITIDGLCDCCDRDMNEHYGI